MSQWQTTKTVTYFRTRGDAIWEFCYPHHVDSSLAEGYTVKRYTSVRRTREEILETSDE